MMRQTEVYEWFICGLEENMLWVLDTRNKIKKCPEIIGEMYGINREWCVFGEWVICLCAFSPSFSCLCGFFSLFFYTDSEYLSTFNVKSEDSWSPICLSAGKLCPRNRLAHVFTAFNTGSFMEDIAFSRAQPPHFGESTWDTGENRTFAYISSGADQSLYGDLAAKCIFCNLKLLLFHNIMLVFAHWGWGVGESGF